jgi:hypothetical protein
VIYTEADEVAGAMGKPPFGATFPECMRLARARMPGESETVVAEVAWSLYRSVNPGEELP